MLHDNEVHNLYRSPSVMIVKITKIWWTEHTDGWSGQKIPIAFGRKPSWKHTKTWRWNPSGMLQRLYLDCLTLKMKALDSFKILTTWSDILEDLKSSSAPLSESQILHPQTPSKWQHEDATPTSMKHVLSAQSLSSTHISYNCNSSIMNCGHFQVKISKLWILIYRQCWEKLTLIELP